MMDGNDEQNRCNNATTTFAATTTTLTTSIQKRSHSSNSNNNSSFVTAERRALIYEKKNHQQHHQQDDHDGDVAIKVIPQRHELLMTMHNFPLDVIIHVSNYLSTIETIHLSMTSKIMYTKIWIHWGGWVCTSSAAAASSSSLAAAAELSISAEAAELSTPVAPCCSSNLTSTLLSRIGRQQRRIFQEARNMTMMKQLGVIAVGGCHRCQQRTCPNCTERCYNCSKTLCSKNSCCRRSSSSSNSVSVVDHEQDDNVETAGDEENRQQSVAAVAITTTTTTKMKKRQCCSHTVCNDCETYCTICEIYYCDACTKRMNPNGTDHCGQCRTKRPHGYGGNGSGVGNNRATSVVSSSSSSCCGIHTSDWYHCSMCHMGLCYSCVYFCPECDTIYCDTCRDKIGSCPVVHCRHSFVEDAYMDDYNLYSDIT